VGTRRTTFKERIIGGNLGTTVWKPTGVGNKVGDIITSEEKEYTNGQNRRRKNKI